MKRFFFPHKTLEYKFKSIRDIGYHQLFYREEQTGPQRVKDQKQTSKILNPRSFPCYHLYAHTYTQAASGGIRSKVRCPESQHGIPSNQHLWQTVFNTNGILNWVAVAAWSDTSYYDVMGGFLRIRWSWLIRHVYCRYRTEAWVLPAPFPRLFFTECVCWILPHFMSKAIILVS